MVQLNENSLSRYIALLAVALCRRDNQIKNNCLLCFSLEAPPWEYKSSDEMCNNNNNNNNISLDGC